jgi:hypothetical protein
MILIKNLKSAILIPVEVLLSLVPDFSQPFDREFSCHSPFLITLQSNYVGKFLFRILFLFRITNGGSALSSARPENITVTLSFSCLAVLTSIDFQPCALTILLTFQKSLGFHLHNSFS